MQTPPNTSAYMIGGYVFTYIVGAIYLLSLILRYRNLQRELEMLEHLESGS